MNIGIDVDGVLRDFVNSFFKVYCREFKLDINTVPLSTDWGIYKNVGISEERFNQIVYESELSHEIMFNALPYEGAIDQQRDLYFWAKELGHTVSIITHQKGLAYIPTINWLDSNGVLFDSLHFTKHKNLVKCDYILDDAPKFISLFANESTVAVYQDRSWNQNISGYRVNNIAEYLQLIKDMEGYGEISE